MKPARRSNHFVGHAIDMNVVDKNGKWCNSGCLRYSLNQNPDVKCFIEKIRKDPDLRWEEILGRQMWSTLMTASIGENEASMTSFTTPYRNTAKTSRRTVSVGLYDHGEHLAPNKATRSKY